MFYSKEIVQKVFDEYIISTPEVANMTGLSLNTIARYVRNNKLVPLGKSTSNYFFYKPEIEELIENAKEKGKTVFRIFPKQ